MAQEINKQGKPYRITIETIGAEEEVFNSGAPLIIETDGFFAITCERHETEDAIERNIGIIAHRISPQEIAMGLTSSDRYDAIKFAMLVEGMKKSGKVVEL